MTEETTTPAAPAEATEAPPAEERRQGSGFGKDPKARPKRRRKVSFLTLNKIEHVDYKDTALLRRFLSDQGKILSARQTGNTAGQQRMVSQAIRRARELALIPFVMIDSSVDRRPGGSRPPRRSDRGPRSD
ncbi:MAG: 30S ribosomal protein S18 [Fimbriimonadales bacterium]